MVSPISTIADMPDGMTVRKRAAGVTTLTNRGSPKHARRLKEQAEAISSGTAPNTNPHQARVMPNPASPKRQRAFGDDYISPDMANPHPFKSMRVYDGGSNDVHHGMEWKA